MVAEKIESENNLHFRWTKYLFSLSILLLLLGIAISWILNNKLEEDETMNPENVYLPFAILTPCSVIAWFIGYYFNNKDMAIIRSTVEKKYIKYYFIGCVLYFCLVILSGIFYIVFINILYKQQGIIKQSNIAFIIVMVSTAVMAIAVIWMNKYSTYCMEYEIYKKRYGEKEKKQPVDIKL
ncbi:MAG: hypothetical protein Ta2E_06980 [Mycoplasmoidaceae bacterium]|nr:MAG: hypothetical protein Ta2E_06980 [Mycoplasmoidaceae bacterium]